MPRVSIVLPTYNRAEFIAEAIDSALAQSFTDFELLIVDDGSTDGTEPIVRSYHDARIDYVWQPNRGRSNARNAALARASGEYITFLDSDDVYLPEKLAIQVALLDSHPQAGMIYTSAACIDQNGDGLPARYEATASGRIYRDIAFFVPVTITLPTVMARRNLLEQVGGFDETMERFEDTDLWRRLSKVTELHACRTVTCKLRTHPGNHLINQDPTTLVSCIDYYAAKILREDTHVSWAELREGLAQFYRYYGQALATVRGWEPFSKKLTEKADCLSIAQNLPKISIVIPVYNGANFLREAIDSALSQTYPNFEILVVNDGSNDNGETEHIAKSYGQKIRYFCKPNGGTASALNVCIREMTGDYFSWLSHDDLYEPHKLERQVNAVWRSQDPRAVFYSDYAYFGGGIDEPVPIRLSQVRPEAFRFWLTCKSVLHGCSLLIPKSAFLECGRFDETLRTTQDYDLWFRIAETYKFVHVPEVLVLSRSHPAQGTVTLAPLMRGECDDLLAKFAKNISIAELTASGGHGPVLAMAAMARNLFLRRFYRASLRAALRCVWLFVRRLPRNVRDAIGLAMWKAYRELQRGARKFRRAVARARLPRRVADPLRRAKSDKPEQALSAAESVAHLALKQKFTEIYIRNIFGGTASRSGAGSDLLQTATIRREIPSLVKELGVASVLDAPCGDWYWMREVDLPIERYIGVDIVESLIERNRLLFSRPRVSFQCMDLCQAELPDAELILSRDCLVHLSFNDAERMLQNFKRSNARYLLTTTFPGRATNSDLGDGFWRPLNLERPPFNFSPPLRTINERCTENGDQFADKSLCLWDLKQLNI